MPQYCAVPDCGQQLPYRTRPAAYHNRVRTLPDGKKAHYRCIKRLERLRVAAAAAAPAEAGLLQGPQSTALALVQLGANPTALPCLPASGVPFAAAASLLQSEVGRAASTSTPVDPEVAAPLDVGPTSMEIDSTSATPAAPAQPEMEPHLDLHTAAAAILPDVATAVGPEAAAGEPSTVVPVPPRPVGVLPSCWVSGESVTLLFSSRQQSDSFVVKCMFARVSFEAERTAFLDLTARGRKDALGPLGHMRELRSKELSADQLQELRKRLLERPERLGHIREKVLRCGGATADSIKENRKLVDFVLQHRLCFRWYPHTLLDAVHNASTPSDVRLFVRELLGLSRKGPSEVERPHRVARILRWVAACVDSVQRHHHVGYLLGDIKPHNIFLDKKFDSHAKEWYLQPVVGDYGFARDLRHSDVSRVAAAAAMAPSSMNAIVASGFDVEEGRVHGTTSYASPEIRDTSHSRLYTAASDAYSLAATLIDILAGETLGDDRFCRRLDCIDRFLNCGQWREVDSAVLPRRGPRPRLPESWWLPGDLLQLLRQLLHSDPAQRPPLASVVAGCRKIQSFH